MIKYPLQANAKTVVMTLACLCFLGSFSKCLNKMCSGTKYLSLSQKYSVFVISVWL